MKAIISKNIGASLGFKLFLFPHSGSGPGPYLKWAESLTEFEIHGVQYPGRGSRFHEDLCLEMNELVQTLVEDLEDQFVGRFAFFGHSLGALVAFEVAQELKRRNRQGPELLVISALPAPNLDIQGLRSEETTIQSVIDMVARVSPEIVEEVKSDSDLQEILLAIFKADFGIVQKYHYLERSQLSCKIEAFGGVEDRYSEGDLVEWQRHTQNAFHLTLFSGGHFYFNDNTEAFLTTLKSILLSQALE